MENTNDLKLFDIRPAKDYKTRIKPVFEENLDNCIEELIQKSGVDKALNKKLCHEYYQLDKKAKEMNKKNKLLKACSVILYILMAVALLAFLFVTLSYKQLPLLTVVLVDVFMGLFAIFAILFNLLFLRKKIKNLTRLYEEEVAKAEKKKQECYESIIAFLKIVPKNYVLQTIEKTIPEVRFSDFYNTENEYLLVNKYGMEDFLNDTQSIVSCISGKIGLSPFVIFKNYTQDLAPYTYTGSITVSVRKTRRDSQGHTETYYVNETLTGYYHGYKPSSDSTTFIAYGNETAPELNFSRKPVSTNGLDDQKKLDKFVKKGVKALEKLEKETLMDDKPGEFVKMTNLTFDTLFGATDRDNEVQFRVMMTPSAQTNLTDLIRLQVPYKDDFYFKKRNQMNYIVTDHSCFYNYEPRIDNLLTFDLEETTSLLKTYGREYFQSLFFDLAPLLSITPYLDCVPSEVIYNDSHVYTNDEVCALCYNLGAHNFRDPQDVTTPVLNASYVSKGKDNTERFCVKAYGYSVEHLVTTVVVHDSNGIAHSCPVHYDEYSRIIKDNFVDVCKANVDDLYERHYDEDKDLANLVNGSEAIGKFGLYHKSMISLNNAMDSFSANSDSTKSPLTQLVDYFNKLKKN